MNSVLTKPKSLQELYRTYFSFANKFEFTTLLRNYIQNEEWKDRSQEQIWGVLSKISDDIGAVLTDDIVNYMRNVVDVNTCKVPQMIEQASMLSYHLDSFKTSYDFFPGKIKCLVDIFSVNPEYLIGNGKNHILSDTVIKEILLYIKNNSTSLNELSNSEVIDKLLDDPHGVTDADTYRNFVKQLFYTSIVDALSSCYSDEDGQPIAFNVLWEEYKNQDLILSRLSEYRSWVDKYIWNEIEHPLNESKLPGTIGDQIQRIKNQKQMSSRFNPFKIADQVYFNGLNPDNGLSEDELDLVERVINYHSKPKYDYKAQMFVDDDSEEGVTSGSTKYAYYKELEFCEYVKLVLFVYNNLKAFSDSELTYDMKSNKFINRSSEGSDAGDCLRVVQIFHSSDDNTLVKSATGDVALDLDIVEQVSQFLCDYVFHIQEIRENMKTIAQKHAMRGSAALLVHMVNDYLIKELPVIRDRLYDDLDDSSVKKHRFSWEIDEDNFNNHGNVCCLEYEDDNEYFNIDPDNDATITERTNARYWEKLANLSDDGTLGVLSKEQIRDFYRETLGMGRLQVDKPSTYDDIADFLVDLFKIGANPIKYDSSEDLLVNPIDDIINKSEEDYGYTKDERVEVQNNTDLRKNQERQFLAYSGNEDLVGEGIYDLVNSRIFYWKNTDYSSHVLHPFMYNLKLWNRLNNIIVNGYRDYINSDLIEYMSSKAKFDQLFGKYGESKNFWKYNILDWTGYTTRYEASIKDEHRDLGTTSELTGYDGLFYPSAAQDYLDLFNGCSDFTIPDTFFVDPGVVDMSSDLFGKNAFIQAIYSIYWQITGYVGSGSTFYERWYSNLNYTRAEYQKLAMQLWYWRDRIADVISTNYSIGRYCLDIQGNSLVLVSPFKDSEIQGNQFLADLNLAQDRMENPDDGFGNLTDLYGNQNRNERVSTCDNRLKLPCELWIRWKSNPIAIPAFDVEYAQKTGDARFDERYRYHSNIEMGQITHTNSDCNEHFKLVINDWNSEYGKFGYGNMLPVFFDIEQSANVIALASWKRTKLVVDGNTITDQFNQDMYITNCSKNPYHIVSIEDVDTDITKYNYVEYGSNETINGSVKYNWLFGAYQYCPASGALLIPFYRFNCDSTRQTLHIKMFTIQAQQLKGENFATNSLIQELGGSSGIEIDLNGKVALTDNTTKHRFDHPIQVCRNTNVVFSAYESSGLNKVKCAFLGNYSSGYELDSFKVNSCEAKTRYEFDSQDPSKLSLLKGRYYTGNDVEKIDVSTASSSELRRYVDEKIATEAYNSYDMNDKYVFMVDFDASIDNKTLFNMGAVSSVSTYSYNILCDAGNIPHFAYQSLVKYGDSDGGVSYTWKNEYLKDRTNMQFELLGLDDKSISEIFKDMSKLVVEDLTDGCSTIFKPTKFVDDIYRVWCDTVGHRSGNMLQGTDWESKEYNRLHHYINNEYKDYSNPKQDFDATGKIVWEVKPVVDETTGTEDYSDLFELNLPNELETLGVDGSDEESLIDAFKSLLDEYYVSIVRSDGYDILNEKRYILQPTQVSKFFLGMGESNDGFINCNISPYQSANIQGNSFVPTQVVFAGTSNPFAYDSNGERIYSKAEELQYGNGIFGVKKIQLKIDIVSVTDTKKDIDDSWNISEKTISHKYLKPTILITKVDDCSDSASLCDRLQMNAKGLDAGQITLIFSHKNLDNIAKFHVLNRRSNLFYGGSLQKSGTNKFKQSDFKFDTRVRLEYDETTNTWKSTKPYDDAGHYLEFKLDDVRGYTPEEVLSNMYFDDRWPGLVNRPSASNFIELQDREDPLPPYYLPRKNPDGSVDETQPEWFLEQDELVSEDDEEITITNGERKLQVDGRELTYEDPHKTTVTRKIPVRGKFGWAHRVKSKPENYLDYLYVENRGLAFKVNEESNSFSEAFDTVPPFYIDERLRNKLSDLNDVQVIQDFSTFIHQSENPDTVKNCSCFNPLLSNVILKYGVLDKEHSMSVDSSNSSLIERIVETGEDIAIQLDNSSEQTEVQLQLEDGEIDEFLKIYTNYVKVDDGNGDFHFDLYFNIQNLFNSPFEYISSITNQPNVLVLKDSYLYLSGDKYTDGKIDQTKVDLIKKGGELSIYGQVKTYSDDKLASVRTIKLFTYKVYNVSDDKPKFLICKTFDITKSSMQNNISNKLKIQFQDVMWTIDESCFVGNPNRKEKLEKSISEMVDRIQALDDRIKYLTNLQGKTTRWNEYIAAAIESLRKQYDKLIQKKCSLQDELLGEQYGYSIVCGTSDQVDDSNAQNVLCEPIADAGCQVICNETDSIIGKGLIACKNYGKQAKADNFRVLAEDVAIIQPLKIWYNWNDKDDSRVMQLSFDISNDLIDFNLTPEPYDYYTWNTTLKDYTTDLPQPIPHYDRWSDRYMKIEKNEDSGNYRLTLTYDKDSGFNFETIYIRWKIPMGCDVMNTIDRLGGRLFGTTATNVTTICNNANSKPEIDVKLGQVQVRVKEIGKMYLGLEHSTTKRINGYVLTGLKDALFNAISQSNLMNNRTQGK